MKMRKLFTCIMALFMMLSAFAGCKPGGGVSDDKSQLNIGLFKAGLGSKWLDEAMEDFTEFYAETSFEEGKMGVELIKDEKTEEFKPDKLSSTMSYNENAIYFLDQADLEMYETSGLLEDISTTVKEKVYDEEGNLAAATGKTAVKSIVDMINKDADKEFNRNGTYYALPYYASISGIIYDADLFNEKGYYFYNDGTLGAKQADIDLGVNGDIGTGPDGKVGTADDGMPVTWKDFISLMKQMANEDNIIPFTWAGKTIYQSVYATRSIWANYQGANDYAINNSLSGTLSDGTVVTEDNFKETLIDQDGRKAAIAAFYDIMSNPKYYSENAILQDHKAAEFEYIDSINMGKRIAFFMEGGYWESEARTFFDTAAILDENLGYGKRDFRLFPIPNFVGDSRVPNQTNTQEAEVLLGFGGESIACIPKQNTCKNPEVQKTLAKLFLQFIHSREQLSNFTANTGGCIRPFTFTVDDEELKNYTKFGKSIYKYIDEGATIVFNYCSEKRQEIDGAAEYKWTFEFKVGDVVINDPATAFYKYPKMTVEEMYQKITETLRKI